MNLVKDRITFTMDSQTIYLFCGSSHWPDFVHGSFTNNKNLNFQLFYLCPPLCSLSFSPSLSLLRTRCLFSVCRRKWRWSPRVLGPLAIVQPTRPDVGLLSSTFLILSPPVAPPYRPVLFCPSVRTGNQGQLVSGSTTARLQTLSSLPLLDTT